MNWFQIFGVGFLFGVVLFMTPIILWAQQADPPIMTDPQPSTQLPMLVVLGATSGAIRVSDSFIDAFNRALIFYLSNSDRFEVVDRTNKALIDYDKSRLVEQLVELRKPPGSTLPEQTRLFNVLFEKAELQMIFQGSTLFIPYIEQFQQAEFHNKRRYREGELVPYKGIELGVTIRFDIISLTKTGTPPTDAIVIELNWIEEIEGEGELEMDVEQRLREKLEEELIAQLEEKMKQAISHHAYFNPYTRVTRISGNQVIIELHEGETIDEGDEFIILSQTQIEGTNLQKESKARVRIYEVGDGICYGTFLEGEAKLNDPAKLVDQVGIHIRIQGGIAFRRTPTALFAFLTNQSGEDATFLMGYTGVQFGLELGYAFEFMGNLIFTAQIPFTELLLWGLLLDVGVQWSHYKNKWTFLIGLQGTLSLVHSSFFIPDLDQKGAIATIGGGAKIQAEILREFTSRLSVGIHVGGRFLFHRDYGIKVGNSWLAQGDRQQLMEDRLNLHTDTTLPTPLYIYPYTGVSLCFSF
jgi:hypothetical protein